MLDTAPSVGVAVTAPQLSVAVAVPSAAFISAVDGLQPSEVVVPVGVIVGAELSNVQVTVLEVVAVPQEFVALNVLV